MTRYKIILLLPGMLLLLCQCLQAQNLEMVQEETFKVQGITADSMIYNLSATQKTTTRIYYDGFGRPIQQVGMQVTPLQKDIIQPIVYDSQGRQTKSYLPYTDGSANGNYRANALTGQAGYYSNGAADKVADDSMPFTQQIIENSPLQRLLQAGSVGTGFQPGEHYSSVNYRSNTSTTDGNIILWLPDGTRSGAYADNSLSVTEATGPDGNKALTFTDKAGRTILKRQVLDATHNTDTYYIYNNAGGISYAIPPKAVKLLTDNPTYTLTQTGVAALIYKYTYDAKGRLASKTIPGAGDLYVIYDPLDRPVLLQDANLRVNNRWNFIKYDVQGRAVVQGYYTDATHTTPAAMQTYVDAMASSYNTLWYEGRSSTSTTEYYTNNVFPTTGTTILACSYYDDYDLNYDASHANDFSYTAQGLAGEGAATTYTRGMLTISRTRSVGLGLANAWFNKIIFYDKRGNVIQVRSNNQLVSTLNDMATSVPDFTGVPKLTKVVKTHGAGLSNTVLSAYGYDAMLRVKFVTQQYNTGSVDTVAKYEYNELGQLIDKKLGVKSTGALQSVDYRYNIRGQLLSINNSKLNVDAANNDETTDVFGEELFYDKSNAQVGSTGTYSGQLTAVKWMSKNGAGTNSNERSYKYTYDGLMRFTQALYAERLSTATVTTNFTLNANGFNEKVTEYDENGNIQALQRYSSTVGGSAGTKIDGLKYTYDTNNLNKLLTVTDTTANAAGFRNYTGTTGSYTYDAAGNLKTDPYKGITAIAYNVLNRVDKVTLTYPSATGRYIDYTYDASGKLLRKRQYDNNVLQNTTDYIDGFVYLNGALSYFGMPEGRVRNTGSSLKAEYIITDHQGNARISFEDSGTGTAKVVQENSYYAFGMSMTSTMAPPTTPNKNLYNGGSEWQNDFADQPDWQQTFYRNYDQTTGRFLAVDPMAEASASMTVYQYAGNNPVMMNDPMGDLSQYVNYAAGGRIGIQDWENGIDGSFWEGRKRYDSEYINMLSYGGGGGERNAAFWNGLLYVNGDFNGYLASYNKASNGGANGVAIFKDLYGTISMLPSADETSYFHQQYLDTDGTYRYSTNEITNQGGSEIAYQGRSLSRFSDGFMGNSNKSDMTSGSSFIGYAGIETTKVEMLLRYTAKTASTWSNRAFALKGVKGTAIFGKSLGAVGAVMTGIESGFDNNGFTWGDGVKVGIGLLTTFTPYGWVYGIVDVGVGLATGTTLTDRIGNGIDNL
jgi:RHS repeat-associated protein